MPTVQVCGDVKLGEALVKCACGKSRASDKPCGYRIVGATEVPRDYVATICGGCDRPKMKCTCSDGDCG